MALPWSQMQTVHYFSTLSETISSVPVLSFTAYTSVQLNVFMALIRSLVTFLYSSFSLMVTNGHVSYTREEFSNLDATLSST